MQTNEIPEYHKEKYPADKFQVYQYAEKFKVNNMYCCGFKEIHGIQNVDVFLPIEGRSIPCYEQLPIPEIIRRMQECVAGVPRKRPYWIWTDNSKKSVMGQRVADFIESNDLGKIIRLPYAHNDNSGNPVAGYICTFSDKWYEYVGP